jgi:hypothetical protein
VPLALLATGAARGRAGFDHRANDVEIGRGLAYHDPTGGLAGVGAVEAKADAVHQLAYVVLGEISVGAGRAAGRAVEALGDTAQDRVAIEVRWLWMRLDDLFSCHVPSLSRGGGLP